MKDCRPLVIDLFCGLGGWSEGFLANGWRCVGFDVTRHQYALPESVPDASGLKGTKPVEKRGWTQGCAITLGMEGAAQRPRTKLAAYPGELVIQDVLTIHGSQFKDADCIVCSPPCQQYSWLAMPWSRSKPTECKHCRGTGLNPPEMSQACFFCGGVGSLENSKAAKALRKKWETEGPDNRLFDACFRIQREAIAATARPCRSCSEFGAIPHRVGWAKCATCDGTGMETRHIPLILENVRGAQEWVGPAKANYGSFYLWGDVGMVGNRIVVNGRTLRVPGGRNATERIDRRNEPDGDMAGVLVGIRNTGGTPDGGGVLSGASKGSGGSWFFRKGDDTAGDRDVRRAADGNGYVMPDGTKIGGDWFSDPNSTCRKHGSRSSARKAASAMIAKIPFPLSDFVARTLKPQAEAAA